jgi:hypothetical protein
VASEAIRDLAAAIVADLRATPRGMTMRELTAGPGPEKGGGPSIKSVRRAIEHCREHGVAIEFDRHAERWRITSERDHLPTAALSREDLLDQLRYALGDDDPLEAIRELKQRESGGWQITQTIPLRMGKRDYAISWVAFTWGDTLVLTAAPLVDDRPDTDRSYQVCKVPFKGSTKAANHFASYLIEVHRADVDARFAGPESEAASW